MSKRKTKTKEKKARYAPLLRLQEVRTMLSSEDGASIYDIADRLHICVRTAIRYLRAIQDAGGVLDHEVVGQRNVYTLKSGGGSISFSVAELIALSLSRRVFDFLAGTGLDEYLATAFQKVEVSLKRRDALHAKNLDRKFFDINEGPHIYENRVEPMNDITTALLNEERLRVTHGSVDTWGKKFILEPYTLIVYKKGLYVAGYSHHHKSIRTFSLDGFRDVDWLRGDGFKYPADYHPAQLSQGAFGIISGPRTQVRLRFDHAVARYVRRRRWHPTQQLQQVGDDLELIMEVDGTTELSSWIRSWGDKVEVLEPEKLREEIAQAHKRAAARYESRGR